MSGWSSRRAVRLVPAAAVAAVLIGCDRPPAEPELHPLTGTVTREGKAVSGGGLIFLPDPPGGTYRVVNAAVGADGRFTAQTESKGEKGLVVRPGAPAGTYKVVYHPPGDGSKMGLEVQLDARVVVEPGGGTVTLALPPVAPKWEGIPRDDADPPAGQEPPAEK